MSSILLPSTRIVQPQVPVEVDWSNPLANKICYFHNAATSNDVVYAGGAKKAASIGGVGYSGFSSASDYVTFNDIRAKVGNRYTIAYVLKNNTTSNQGFGDWSSNSAVEHYAYSGTGYLSFASLSRLEFSTSSYNQLLPHCLVGVINANGTGNTGSIYCNNRLIGTGTPGGSNNGLLASPTVGYSPGYGSWNGCFYGFIVWDRLLSDTEAKSISINPWQIFRPRTLRIWFDMGAASGGAAVLEGSASGAASATGALTTGIPIAGAALSAASASGTLDVAIPLSGAAASMSAASGSLTAQITLAGSALAQAVSSALLSSGITMTAAAVAQAAADGTLTTAIALLGGAQAQAGGSGSLTTGTGGLEGNALASASASASLSTQIRLSGAAIASAGASGSLGGSANLAGTAVSTASASGELTVNIALTAQALASAIAQGSLTAQILLDADAAAQAQAGAALSGGSALVVPDTLQIITAPAGRPRRAGFLYGHRHGIKIGA